MIGPSVYGPVAVLVVGVRRRVAWRYNNACWCVEISSAPWEGKKGGKNVPSRVFGKELTCITKVADITVASHENKEIFHFSKLAKKAAQLGYIGFVLRGQVPIILTSGLRMLKTSEIIAYTYLCTFAGQDWGCSLACSGTGMTPLYWCTSGRSPPLQFHTH